MVKPFDEGSENRKFGHAIVAGIDRYPRRVRSTENIWRKTTGGMNPAAAAMGGTPPWTTMSSP